MPYLLAGTLALFLIILLGRFSYSLSRNPDFYLELHLPCESQVDQYSPDSPQTQTLLLYSTLKLTKLRVRKQAYQATIGGL